MKEKTAAERVRYAKRYIGVLVNGDASPLLGLSPDKRIHSMKGIASLSRFLGCYDKWMQILPLWIKGGIRIRDDAFF